MKKHLLQKQGWSVLAHWLILAVLLSSCTQAQEMVGEHPHVPLPAVVEAYLEKYQPGPMPRLFQTTHIYDRNGVQLAEIFGEGRRIDDRQIAAIIASCGEHVREAGRRDRHDGRRLEGPRILPESSGGLWIEIENGGRSAVADGSHGQRRGQRRLPDAAFLADHSECFHV